MKYYTFGIIFLFISLVTILMSFYYSNLTRPIEKEIVSIQFQINSLQDKLKINELEYAAHLNPDYLERLEQIYFFNKYSKGIELKVIGMQEFKINDLERIIKVSSN